MSFKLKLLKNKIYPQKCILFNFLKKALFELSDILG